MDNLPKLPTQVHNHKHSKTITMPILPKCKPDEPKTILKDIWFIILTIGKIFAYSAYIFILFLIILYPFVK